MPAMKNEIFYGFFFTSKNIKKIMYMSKSNRGTSLSFGQYLY